MCHLSIKLSDMFDQNRLHTSDKIVVKHIQVKRHFKLDLEPKKSKNYGLGIEIIQANIFSINIYASLLKNMHCHFNCTD